MDPNILIIRKTKLVFPELSYKISGLLFKVHNELGRFCKEKSYSDAIEQLLLTSGLPFEREKKLEIKMMDNFITKNWADFVIDGKIVLEIKAKRFVTREDYIQTARYLDFLNLPLGMLVNFNQKFLKPKRVLNPNLKN